MNKLNRYLNTRNFSRHKFQKFYFKKSLRCQSPAKGGEEGRRLKTQIYRPFIQFSRFEFLKFCEFWYLPVIPDFTNLNVHFPRNRLRLQSLPYLKFFFNIDLFQKINSIQKIINLENEYFQLIIQKLLLTSLKSFQYSERKKSFRSSGQKAIRIVKHRNPFVNSVSQIFKPASFTDRVQNLGTSQSSNVPQPPIASRRDPWRSSFPEGIAPRCNLARGASVQFKSVMFKIYRNTVQLRGIKRPKGQKQERGDVIFENIEKNIQIYCPYLGFIALFKQNHRFYYKFVKSYFQAIQGDFKGMRQMMHPRTCIAMGDPRFAHRLPQLAQGIEPERILEQVYNIELFFWIHKYFRTQFKQKQSLLRTTQFKIKLDLNKKKFNQKLLQKTTGSEIHFIQYNLLGLKPIDSWALRSQDLSTSHFFYFARYNFLYFPKILQYRILHNFYHFIQKKISFNEISCIFQRITIFLNPKSSKKK